MQKKKSPQIIDSKEGEVVERTRTCQKCQNEGLSNEKLTKIENFKDVTISESACNNCGFEQKIVDFVEKKNDFGIEIFYQVQHSIDGEREVIHSEIAKVEIEELNITLSFTEKPQITTIKGLVERAVEELRQKVNITEKENEENRVHLERAEKLLQTGLFPLTIRIRDPSGNSNVKNLNFPLPDKNIQICYFERTVEELMAFGFTQEEAEKEVKLVEERKKGIKLNFNKPFEEKDFMHKEPVVFEVPCHTCMMPGEMKLCETSVPYFTDLVIMSFSCEYCGAHSVETKNSGEVHDEALEITLKVDTIVDLKRDLFKSDTCKVCIPEVDLELDYGTLGGQYTTVEGLLEKVHEHLSGRNQFVDMDGEFSERMQEFLGNLLQMKDGEKPFTLHLIDPLSRSFLQNPFHPEEDHKAKRVVRARNEEEDDFLGFSGMNVDNYN